MKNTRGSAPPAAPPATRRFSGTQLLLAATLAAAAGLRLWHIDWGLPALYEEATPLVQAWKIWTFGQPGIDLNPHFFNYPAFTIYLNFLLQALHYGIGHLAGAYATLEQFGGTVESHVLPARLLGAAFDVGTVYLTYILGRRIATGTVGLAAAALVAINPLHIAQAHYITVDVPLTFFTVLSLLWVTKAAESGSLKHHLLAGAAIGLAAASKYTGAFILVAYAVGIAGRGASWRAGLAALLERPFLSGVAASVIVFCLVNPYIILSFDEFYQDFSFEQYHVATGHLGITTGQATIDFYLFEVLGPSISWVLLFVCFATIVRTFLRSDRRLLAMVVFAVVFVGIISTWEMRADRYLLPVVPLLLIVGACGAVIFWNELRGTRFVRTLAGGGPVVSRAVWTVVAAAVVVPVALRTVSYERSLTLPDTRTLAREWVQQNVPWGGMIASGSFGIDLPKDAFKVLYIPFLILEAERVAPFYDARWYTDFDLLIASSFDRDRYAADPEKYADFLPYYDSLRAGWKLAGEISPQEYQSGPAFWFYEPTEAVQSRTFGRDLFEKLHGAIESARISNFLNNLSYVLQQKGKQEKAEEVLREILSVEVDNLKARNSLAFVLSRQGKYEQALLETQRSLRLDINQPNMFTFAGSMLLMLGKTREAELSYYKAISLDNEYLPAHKDLIGLYRQINDRQNLLTALLRYRALLPAGDQTSKQLDAEIAELRQRR